RLAVGHSGAAAKPAQDRDAEPHAKSYAGALLSTSSIAGEAYPPSAGIKPFARPPRWRSWRYGGRRSLFAGFLPAGYHLRLLPLAGRRTMGMAALVVLQLRLGLVGFALPFRSGIALAGGRFLHAHDSLLVP